MSAYGCLYNSKTGNIHGMVAAFLSWFTSCYFTYTDDGNDFHNLIVVNI